MRLGQSNDEPARAPSVPGSVPKIGYRRRFRQPSSVRLKLRQMGMRRGPAVPLQY